MNNIAYLSLGSNIGDREQSLMAAIEKLGQQDLVNVVAISSIYETDPVGYTEQDHFLNIVIKIATSLSAIELLELCLNIEDELGRIRGFKWGPRKIDLDILLYNNKNIELEALQIPHPRMTERAFVLIPLLEIDGDVTLPPLDIPLIEFLNEIPDQGGVRLWKQISGEGGSALFEN